MCVCVCVCVCKIFFNAVNPEFEIIPRKTNNIFKNRILNLNNPGHEVNVYKIHRENNFLLNKIKQKLLVTLRQVYFHPVKKH